MHACPRDAGRAVLLLLLVLVLLVVVVVVLHALIQVPAWISSSVASSSAASVSS